MHSGRVRALNSTVLLGSGRVGSDNLGYGPGSGFSFEPVQTSSSGSAYTTACSNSCQYPATSHRHYTGHNKPPDQLYAKEMCYTAWGKWWSHQILTGFLIPQYSKTALLEWPFIEASLRHTCAIIMLSNQHLDMPHLWGGWIISAKKCSLTQI